MCQSYRVLFLIQRSDILFMLFSKIGIRLEEWQLLWFDVILTTPATGRLKRMDMALEIQMVVP